MESIVSKIGFQWDQARQVLWFHAELSSGAHLDVGFPLAHVAATFDSKMVALGFCGASLGSIPSIDGLRYEIERMQGGPNPRLRSAVGSALHSMMQQLTGEGLHYGAAAHDVTLGGTFAETIKRVKDVLKLGPEYPYDPVRNIVGNLTPELVKKYKLTKQQISDHQNAQIEWYDPGNSARFASYREGQKHTGTDKTFGSEVTKALQSAGESALKVATTVPRAVGGTALDITKGKNVVQTLKARGTDFAKDTVAGAKQFANVATLIPGIGTAAAFAIQYTSSVADAVARGKNIAGSLEHAAIDAALNSLPGGELTGAAIRTVANIVAAGVQGQNVLKSAANELTAAAISFVPNEQARQVLQSAADAALNGQNVLQGAKAAAINTALQQVSDPSARQAIAGVLQGKSPEQIVQGAGQSLLSRAAAAAPTGGAAAVVTGIVGKSPGQLIAAAQKTIAPVMRSVAAPGALPSPSRFFQGISADELSRYHVRA